MGSSHSKDPVKESISPDSDSSSVPDIASPIVVLQQEPQDLPIQPPVEEPPVEEPSVEEPLVEEPPVEEPSVEEPLVEEPSVEEPLVEQSPAGESPVQPPVKESSVPTPDVVVAEAIVEKDLVNEETPAVIKPDVTVADLPVMTPGSFAEMIRDVMIKNKLPRNVKFELTMTPVSYTINRNSANKPSQPVSDVVEMAEATSVVFQPAPESESAPESEQIPEVMETRSEDS